MYFYKFIILFFVIILATSITNATLPTCLAGTTTSDPSLAKDVKFSDILQIYHLGDTISAGLFAGDSYSFSTNEYRGNSFGTGNETDSWTIYNYLKQSVTGLIGGSANMLTGERSPGSYNAAYDGFNSATKGADTNINGEVTFLKNQGVAKVGLTNFNNQWKMLNVYTGVFRACSVCSSNYAAYQTYNAYWSSHYDDVLNNITSIFSSKTMINFIGLPKITQFYSSSATLCSSYNQGANICPCLWSQSTTVLNNVINAANNGMKLAISNWRASHDQYTTTVGITYQPFLEDTIFPSDWISPVDCFHPSLDGHKYMSIGLWNNIRQQNSKSTSITTSSSMLCGTPYNALYSPDASY